MLSLSKHAAGFFSSLLGPETATALRETRFVKDLRRSDPRFSGALVARRSR